MTEMIAMEYILDVLKTLGRANICDIAQMSGIPRSLVADYMVGMMRYLNWVQADDASVKAISYQKIESIRGQFEQFDRDVFWSLRKKIWNPILGLQDLDEQNLCRLFRLSGDLNLEQLADQLDGKDGLRMTSKILNTKKEEPELFREIFHAIEGKRILKIQYLDEPLRIEPLRLVKATVNELYYLVGWIHNNREKGYQHFRLDRITELRITGACFEVAHEGHIMDIGRYIATLFNMDATEMQGIRLIVYNDGSKAIEKARTLLKRLGDIHYDELGNMMFSGDLTGINGYKVLFRSLGSSLLVLEPDSLRRDMIKSYKRKADVYSRLEEIDITNVNPWKPK